MTPPIGGPAAASPVLAPQSPPAWWPDLTAAQRKAIVARLKKVRKTKPSTPDATIWPK